MWGKTVAVVESALEGLGGEGGCVVILSKEGEIGKRELDENGN